MRLMRIEASVESRREEVQACELGPSEQKSGQKHRMADNVEP